MITKEKLLTMDQVANVLGITKKTLYQWSWRNQNLPFIRVGRALRVSEKDLFEFIEKRRRKPEDN